MQLKENQTANCIKIKATYIKIKATTRFHNLFLPYITISLIDEDYFKVLLKYKTVLYHWWRHPNARSQSDYFYFKLRIVTYSETQRYWHKPQRLWDKYCKKINNWTFPLKVTTSWWTSRQPHTVRTQTTSAVRMRAVGKAVAADCVLVSPSNSFPSGRGPTSWQSNKESSQHTFSRTEIKLQCWLHTQREGDDSRSSRTTYIKIFLSEKRCQSIVLKVA